MKNRSNNIFVFCVLFIFSINVYAQKSPSKIGLNLDVLSTTKAYYLNPSFQYKLKKHYAFIGVLLGKHHTLNAYGYGLNIGDRFFPNERMNRFNLFFTGSIQLTVFDKFPTSSIKQLRIVQANLGYGFDLKINQRLSLSTFFSIGFLVEQRKFIQIDSVITIDAAGVLSLGMTYLFFESREEWNNEGMRK